MEKQLFFKWKPEYDLGIDIIDEQHKKLVGYINELFISVKDLKQKEQAQIVVQKLFDYTNFHFGMEEKYFKRYDWESSSSHLKEHQIFVNKILEFQKILEKELPATFQIINFLKDWFKNHILVSDKKYVSFFKDKMTTVI